MKYAFDKMIELDIPESVTDFIEARGPKRIGAKHYLALAKESAKFYLRYMEYIEARARRHWKKEKGALWGQGVRPFDYELNASVMLSLILGDVREQ